MTATTGDRLLTDYLARLDAAALRLPPDRRADLMEGIAEHVAAARAAGELCDEAAVRTLLDRLGEPEEIVAAASEEVAGGSGGPSWGGRAPQLVPRRPGTALETAAVLMLTVGSLIPIAGWLVGVVLLWTSRRWRTGEKLLGTLVVPGGPGILLPLSAFTVRSSVCTTNISGTVSGGTGGVLVLPEPPPAPGAPAPDPAPPVVEFTPPAPMQETEACESGALLPTWLLIPLLLFALLAPFVVAVVLLRRARARAAAEPPVLRPVSGSPWGGLEIAAVALLGLGSFVLPVIAPIVGLVLAWSSSQWTTAEKGVATALVLAPAALLVLVWGLALMGLALGFAPIGGGLLLLALFFGVGPLLAAGYLALVLSRR